MHVYTHQRRLEGVVLRKLHGKVEHPILVRRVIGGEHRRDPVELQRGE